MNKNLEKTEKDGSRFVFSSAKALEGVNNGDVVILGGIGVRRVSSLERRGSETILDTTSATLADAIEEGEIGWEFKPDFRTPQGKAIAYSMAAGLTGVAFAEDEKGSLSFKGDIKGWTVTLELKPPSSDRLDFTLKAVRSIGGKDVGVLKAKGFVKAFTTSGSASFAGGEASSFEIKTRNIEGEVELEWAAAVEESAQAIIDSVALKVPAAIPIPFTVGPIPVVLKIKAEARVTPDVRFPESSSRGSFKVVYNADNGFSFASGKASPIGGISKHEPDITGPVNSAGRVTTGLGFGVEFPRIEVSLAGELIVPYVSVDTYTYSLVEPGLLSNAKPCQWGALVSKGVAGYDLTVFGFATLSSGKKELWSKEFKRYAGGVPCD